MHSPTHLTVKVSTVKVLGEQVRARRKALGLSQSQLSAVCGVGVRFLSDLENGKSTIEFTKAIQVLDGLGLEMILRNKGLGILK